MIVSFNVFYLSFQSFIHLLGHSVLGDYAMHAAGFKSRSSALFSGSVFAFLAFVFIFRLVQEIWHCCCRKKPKQSKHESANKNVPRGATFNAIANFFGLFSIRCAYSPYVV